MPFLNIRLRSFMLLGLIVTHQSFALADIISANQAAPMVSSISSQSISDTYVISALTPSTYSQLTVDQQKTVADMWHLSVTDYTHYLQLMSNSVNAVYYKDRNLDPSWILGFNAKDEQERQKYVVIAIQNERERIEKELAFQRDFTELQKTLFPNEMPVRWIQENTQTTEKKSK